MLEGDGHILKSSVVIQEHVFFVLNAKPTKPPGCQFPYRCALAFPIQVQDEACVHP